MLRAARGNMWVKNYQNGFNSRMTYHMQSVLASNDAASYQLLANISSTVLDRSQVTEVTNKTTGAFFMVCGMTECGSDDQCA
jgi:hypothetical protein